MNKAKPCDFTSLPIYQPRRFVPESANLTDAGEVEKLYATLRDRGIASAAELDQWLLDRSELQAAVGQQETVLNIAMTCQTDDPQRADAYRRFVTNVGPVIQRMGFELDRKYLDASSAYPLQEWYYMVHDRNTRADVEVFRPENVELISQEQLLNQEYQTITGTMMVHFRGKDYTPPQMAKFLLEPDRALRQEAWLASSARRLQDKDKLEDLFAQMFDLRSTIARNAGMGSYRDYIWKACHRFDYSVEDCFKFHDAVEKVVVPVLKEIAGRRREAMKVDALRPWDLDCDELNRPPLKPFETVGELTSKVHRIFTGLDPVFAAEFKEMIELGLLDLASRKGKAPGGYQSTLWEARKPFIFMNAVGTQQDVNTLLHESGHSFHSYAAADEELFSYRHAPLEFAEVASMGMELLAAGGLREFYDETDLKRCRKERFEKIIEILAWIAVIDSFQHWLYEHPGHGRDDRRLAWLAAHERFDSSMADWTGLDEQHAFLWHRQLHIFIVPFYYIEYGIAQIGALQLWSAARKNSSEALAAYKAALEFGGSRTLAGLFEAAGLKFDFGRESLGPLVDEVCGEL